MGLNKVSWKSFVIGAITGVVLFSGIGFAATTIEVSVNPVKFFFNGEEIKTQQANYIHNGIEYIPKSLMYKGTVYVPTRFLSEAIGQKVDWDNQTKSVLITDTHTSNEEPNDSKALKEDEDYTVVDTNTDQLPSAIEKWIEDHKKQEYQGTMELNGSTYILITRGEKSSGGYTIELEGIVTSSNEIVVKAKYKNPNPDDSVTMALTYPTLLIKIPETSSKDVTFDIDKSEDTANHTSLK